MSAMQRRKGATSEREVVAILNDHGWPNARRTSDGWMATLPLDELALLRLREAA